MGPINKFFLQDSPPDITYPPYTGALTRFILNVTVFINMKSMAGIDYVDASSDGDAGDGLDDAPTDAPDSSEVAPDASLLVSGDVHAVMLGLWASGLRYVIVHALAPAIGAVGPLTVGAATVIQVAGAAVCVSGARSLWMRRDRGRRAYAFIAVLTCLCTLAALLAPAGF